MTYVGEWNPTDWQFLSASVSDSEVLANVTNDLANNQGITVESQQINRPAFGGKIAITLVLVTTNVDHAHVDDVRTIVDHSFYVAASPNSALGSALPSASRISDYTLPGTVSKTSTGAPPAPPDDPSGNDPGSIFSSLGDALPSSGMLLAIAGVVVVGLIAIAYTSSRI